MRKKLKDKEINSKRKSSDQIASPKKLIETKQKEHIEPDVNINVKGLDQSSNSNKKDVEPNPNSYIYNQKIATFSKYPGRVEKKSQP